MKYDILSVEKAHSIFRHFKTSFLTGGQSGQSQSVKSGVSHSNCKTIAKSHGHCRKKINFEMTLQTPAIFIKVITHVHHGTIQITNANRRPRTPHRHISTSVGKIMGYFVDYIILEQ